LVGTDVTGVRLDAGNSQSTLFLFNFIRIFSVDVLQYVNKGNYISAKDTHRSLNLCL
jgi:hypothetical protein